MTGIAQGNSASNWSRAVSHTRVGWSWQPTAMKRPSDVEIGARLQSAATGGECQRR